MSKQRARKILCWLFGHKWEGYNFTQPVIISRGNTWTYTKFGQKCKRCGFDEYRGVQSFIDFVTTKKKSEE